MSKNVNVPQSVLSELSFEIGVTYAITDNLNKLVKQGIVADSEAIRNVEELVREVECLKNVVLSLNNSMVSGK